MNCLEVVLDLSGEITGSVGVTVVAYVTAEIVHLKARGIARRESRELSLVLLDSLTVFVDILMTVVRQPLVDCPDVFWDNFGEVVSFVKVPHGLHFGAKLVSCTLVNGGKVMSPPCFAGNLGIDWN